MEVILENYEDANKILSDPDILSKNCHIIVPYHRVFRKGIIRGVDLDVTDSEILQDAWSQYKIHSIKRITKRNPDAKKDKSLPARLPTKSIIISFHGQELPRHVYLYHISHEVQPFVAEPRMCYSCYRPRHTSSNCRRTPLCRNCADPRHEGECKATTVKCATCGGPHKALDRTCQTIQRERAIERIMAYENKPRDDARRVVDGVDQRSNAIASREAYPGLTPKETFADLNRFQSLNQNSQNSPEDTTEPQFYANLRKPTYRSPGKKKLQRTSQSVRGYHTQTGKNNKENFSIANSQINSQQEKEKGTETTYDHCDSQAFLPKFTRLPVYNLQRRLSFNQNQRTLPNNTRNKKEQTPMEAPLPPDELNWNEYDAHGVPADARQVLNYSDLPTLYPIREIINQENHHNIEQ